MLYNILGEGDFLKQNKVFLQEKEEINDEKTK